MKWEGKQCDFIDAVSEPSQRPPSAADKAVAPRGGVALEVVDERPLKRNLGGSIGEVRDAAPELSRWAEV